MRMKTFAPLVDPDSVLPIVSEIAIFGGVSDRQLNVIVQCLEKGEYAKGEYIFRKGDDPSHIYVVKQGKIDLLITDQDVILQKKTLGIGDCFGVASLMAMHKHTATAVALEQSEVVVLSRKALLRLQNEDRDLFCLLMMNIARELARRLKLTDEILLRYLRTHKSG